MIEIKTSSSSGDYVESLISFSERVLGKSDYHAGQIETLESGQTNVSRAIGKLLDLLLQKGVLDEKETLSVLGEEHNPDVSFYHGR